jgi:hypothetical protein
MDLDLAPQIPSLSYKRLDHFVKGWVGRLQRSKMRGFFTNISVQGFFLEPSWLNLTFLQKPLTDFSLLGFYKE